MIFRGYTGKFLLVDLSKKAIKTIEWNKEDWLPFIGGRGFGAKIIWEMTDKSTEPLSPNNVVAINAGPLTGTHIPGAGRVSITSISPLTNIWADSSMGGYFGAEMKHAGYDVIILKGANKEPKYLSIEDDDIELKKADELWGRDTYKTESMLKKDLGDNVRIMCIGPAGENLVKFASINHEFGRQSGRTGIGAIFGAKKLKAITVRGTKDVKVADLLRLNKRIDYTIDFMRNNDKDWHEIFLRHGTMTTYEWCQSISALPTKNFKETEFEKWNESDGFSMEKRIKVGKKACHCCTSPCGNISKVQHNNQNNFIVGPDYETAGLLGPNCGIEDIESIAQANYLCDIYGLDTISTGNVIGFAMECYENGLLGTDGLKLEWGNATAMMQLIEMIAYRQGIGNILAEGVKKAAEYIENGSEMFTMHVKGLEQSAYETRGAPGMTLAYATSDVGAHHSRSTIISWEIKNTDRFSVSEEKVEKQIELEHQRSLFDALGTCRFQWCELRLPLNIFAQFFRAVTGLRTSLESLLVASERIFNLTRMINVRRGITKKDDIPPKRVFMEEIPSGELKGRKMQYEGFKAMISWYYDLRGWDQETGIPTRETLEKLGLSFVL